MKRPRLRRLSRWLSKLAWRIYPEPLYTLTVTTAERSVTFIDCRTFAVNGELRQEQPA